MALNPKATPDCVFYGDSETTNTTELATDDSQEATDITAGAGVVSNTGSRFAPASYSEFTVLTGVTMNNAVTGTLWSYRDDACEIKISAGTITVRWNASDLITYAVTNISASLEAFTVVLAVEANPLTTGAGNVLRAELHVLNATQQTCEIARATMAANGSGTSSTMVWGARDTGGTNIFGGSLYDLAFYRTFHHSTWAWENFVTETSAPTLAGEERLEVHVPAKSTGIGDDGHLAGPILLLGAANAAASDLRLVGPLVNEWYRDAPELTIAGHPFVLETNDGTSALLHKSYLYRRPVPPTVNKARARVFFQMYRTDGAANDTLTVYVYSMSQPGHLYKPPHSPAQQTSYYVSKSYTTSHGSGATDGVWCDFDLADLKLARDDHDYTYLCIGYKVVDAGGANTPENQKFKFRALTIDPFYSLADGELPSYGGG